MTFLLKYSNLFREFRGNYLHIYLGLLKINYKKILDFYCNTFVLLLSNYIILCTYERIQTLFNLFIYYLLNFSFQNVVVCCYCCRRCSYYYYQNTAMFLEVLEKKNVYAFHSSAVKINLNNNNNKSYLYNTFVYFLNKYLNYIPIFYRKLVAGLKAYSSLNAL